VKEPRPPRAPPCSEASVKLRSPVRAFFEKIPIAAFIENRSGFVELEASGRWWRNFSLLKIGSIQGGI
jgi:hypothetical protein